MFDLSPDYNPKCHRFLRLCQPDYIPFSRTCQCNLLMCESISLSLSLSLGFDLALALLQVVARNRGGVATIVMPAVVRIVRQSLLNTRRIVYAAPQAIRAFGPGLEAVVALRLDPIRFARPQHHQLRIIIHTWMMRIVRSELAKHSMRNWIGSRCDRRIHRIRIRRTVSAAR